MQQNSSIIKFIFKLIPISLHLSIKFKISFSLLGNFTLLPPPGNLYEDFFSLIFCNFSLFKFQKLLYFLLIPIIKDVEYIPNTLTNSIHFNLN